MLLLTFTLTLLESLHIGTFPHIDIRYSYCLFIVILIAIWGRPLGTTPLVLGILLLRGWPTENALYMNICEAEALQHTTLAASIPIGNGEPTAAGPETCRLILHSHCTDHTSS